jgi:hypothetical protein
MVHLSTVVAVEDILRHHALGIGLEVADVRRLHPAKDVRRRAIVAALRHLEDHGLVAWTGERVRWCGPLPEDAKPLGVALRRIARDARMAPEERVAAALALSHTLLPAR